LEKKKWSLFEYEQIKKLDDLFISKKDLIFNFNNINYTINFEEMVLIDKDTKIEIRRKNSDLFFDEKFKKTFTDEEFNECQIELFDLISHVF
jgi:hypothetical protein